MKARKGNDTVNGGNGGAGDDEIDVADADGNDTVDCGDGVNTATIDNHATELSNVTNCENINQVTVTVAQASAATIEEDQ